MREVFGLLFAMVVLCFVYLGAGWMIGYKQGQERILFADDAPGKIEIKTEMAKPPRSGIGVDFGAPCKREDGKKKVGVCFFVSDTLVRDTPCPHCRNKALNPAGSPMIQCSSCGWRGNTNEAHVGEQYRHLLEAMSRR